MYIFQRKKLGKCLRGNSKRANLVHLQKGKELAPQRILKIFLRQINYLFLTGGKVNEHLLYDFIS